MSKHELCAKVSGLGLGLHLSNTPGGNPDRACAQGVSNRTPLIFTNHSLASYGFSLTLNKAIIGFLNCDP
jgi:hypothetical protein